MKARQPVCQSLEMSVFLSFFPSFPSPSLLFSPLFLRGQLASDPQSPRSSPFLPCAETTSICPAVSSLKSRFWSSNSGPFVCKAIASTLQTELTLHLQFLKLKGKVLSAPLTIVAMLFSFSETRSTQPLSVGRAVTNVQP